MTELNAPMRVGLRIKELRGELGVSQESFAYSIEMSRTYLAEVEVGRRNVSIEEEAGTALVIRPPVPLEIGAVERDPIQLRRVYETGRAVAEKQLDRVQEFLASAKATE